MEKKIDGGKVVGYIAEAADKTAEAPKEAAAKPKATKKAKK